MSKNEKRTRPFKSRLVPGEMYVFKDEASFNKVAPYICCCKGVGASGHYGFFNMWEGIINETTIMMFLNSDHHECQVDMFLKGNNSSPIAKFLHNGSTLFFMEESVTNLDVFGQDLDNQLVPNKIEIQLPVFLHDLIEVYKND